MPFVLFTVIYLCGMMAHRLFGINHTDGVPVSIASIVAGLAAVVAIACIVRLLFSGRGN